MLFTLPQSSPAPIARLIEEVRSQLAIKVYYLYDGLVLRSIRRLVDRGVTVRVMVDRKFYGIRRSNKIFPVRYGVPGVIAGPSGRDRSWA